MSYDVIVIGGGIIGATCAYYLARNTQKVLLLERDEIAQGTTSNSFAWANGTSKTTDQAYHDLNAIGLATYHSLMAEFGADALGITTGGALQLADPADTAGFKSLKQQATALNAFNYPARWIDNDALQDLEPHLTLPATIQALFSPDDLCLDAPHFTRFITDQFRQLGGDIIVGNAARTLLATDDGVVTGLATDTDTISAPNILIATGQHTGETLATLTGYDGFASRFPMRQVPGLLLTTPPIPHGHLNRLIYSPPNTDIHILPEQGGGIKIGSDDIDGMITDDTSDENINRAGQLLLDRAATLLPVLKTIDIASCTLGIGVRPYPNDGKSIASALPGAKGLYVIATHSGITLAPSIGQLMAQYIRTGATPKELAPFSLERFAGFS